MYDVSSASASPSVNQVVVVEGSSTTARSPLRWTTGGARRLTTRIPGAWLASPAATNSGPVPSNPLVRTRESGW